jgi:predicted acyl esterase
MSDSSAGSRVEGQPGGIPRAAASPGPIERTSVYVEVRGGTRLAADIYLPLRRGTVAASVDRSAHALLPAMPPCAALWLRSGTNISRRKR